ncbi:MAG TPA: glycosyltransferase [Caulobacteraceae bacterium]|nr:glycosyltransferase [Caulobacteraceae bacterium]
MKLSLTVCTRNRADKLTACLDSMAAARARAGLSEAEIVVVDNGSTDGTSDLTRAWAARTGESVNLVFEPRAGLSRARNAALAAVTGEIIAFTDDDCRLDENYVVDLLRHDAGDEAPVLRGGRRELGDPEDLPISIYTYGSRRVWSRASAEMKRLGLDGFIAGANMAARRTLFESVGPFDIRLGAGTNLPGGEDTDYYYRTYQRGFTLEYVPDMAIYHHHGRRDRETARRLYECYWRGRGALFVKHLFAGADYRRPFLHDAKSALIETFSGRRDSLPVTGHSSGEKVLWELRGALEYVAVASAPSS